MDQTKPRVAAVLPAAGRGKRFGSPENKIWALLSGVSVLQRSLTTFCQHPLIDYIVVVAAADEVPRVWSLFSRLPQRPSLGLEVVVGGDTRATSVHNGIKALPQDIDVVLVHDAARPLVSHQVIQSVIDGVLRTGAAVPGIPLSDTIKRIDTHKRVRATIPRSTTINNEVVSGLVAVQTPQGARLPLLREAYERFDFATSEPTDEASLIEAMGGGVEVVMGESSNIKITRQEDMILAERLLDFPKIQPTISRLGAIPETRIGFGYDVHAFASPESGRKLFLGGVEIPHDRGLEGHSDADVLLHAVCDALLGAVSLGDIGILFPNTDPQYKGISSLRLLENVVMRVRSAGWDVVNIDATLVAEAPKLMPYRNEIQAVIAHTLRIPEGRVSVKATTSEKMGFVGRREGIACWATAHLREN